MLGSWKSTIKLSIVVGAVLLAGANMLAPKASAQYVQSNLIDDTLFLDAASMNQDQIQTFLNNRGGYIANYYSWSTRDNASVSAARIIMDAAYDYGVSPKVILATLQKEQGLVTAKNPVQSQIDFAMGYGCPDSAGCSSAHKGFFAQVDNATWQLRYNFERARGNNTWWRSSSSYACPGATRYYSTGLYVGNTVTFYDEAGYGYATFPMGDAATASLYCYTPHAYPGDSTYYYSGSYNFVTAYEAWFGSTQPAVVISSPLQVSALPQGLYTKTPVAVSFSLTNNQNYAMGVGQMAVSVRDSHGNNLDYGLQQMTVPAFSTIHYTATQMFSSADTYSFSIADKAQDGTWSSVYPSSSNIDNARTVSAAVQPMPVVSVAPSVDVTDMRQGKTGTFSFGLTNSSATTVMNVGKVSLAIRGPNNQNYDLALKSVTLAANGSYSYSDTFMPTAVGTYHAFISATTDNGSTWGNGNYPVSAPGIGQTLDFTVKSSPTLTQGLTLSNATPRAGQQFNMSFKVKNYGDQSVNLGKMAVAVRDPQGRNVDAAPITANIAGNTESTFQSTVAYTTPGTYTAYITGTQDNVNWYDNTYPSSESSSIVRGVQFTVLPSPTLTIQPTITTLDPRVGKAVTATFTLHNYGSTDVNLGQMALSARDPQGHNVDFALKPVTVPAGSDYVYAATNPGTMFQSTGQYSAMIIRTQDSGASWDTSNYAALDSGSVARSITFQVSPNPTITTGLSISVPSPHVGQAVSLNYGIKNYGDQSVNLGKMAVAVRDPSGRNVDPAPITVTISPNTAYAFQTASTTFTTPGTYTAYITGTQDNVNWYDNTYPISENSSIVRSITFTVQP